MDRQGRILVTRRPDHVHQGGLWEFPGGKVDPGETLQEALRRELEEELGIRVEASEPLIRVRHDYPERRVVLDVHRVLRYSDTPHGREGQPLRWLTPDAMRGEEFPAADRPIITALRLPDRVLITPPFRGDFAGFLGRVEAALASGMRMIQLRAPGLDAGTYRKLAERCLVLCNTHSAELVLNPPDDSDSRLPGAGLHLNSRRLVAARRRPHDITGFVGASCHDLRELEQAEELGLDYVFLSPVAATGSHPGAEPLGWEVFSVLAERATLPVYALGGMALDDLGRAKALGGQGIAAISAFWPEL